ncbi:tRNA 2-thiocytidine(32) synthetase TtcA [Peptococcaceae bacterium]|nr:tRNA 2-thiocytidine(32) synthetase TtcA [Peptococcaceae bacterium]
MKNKSNIFKWVLSETVRAIADYKMIENGDHVAVGISGGKDSLALLHVLAHYQKYYPYNFKIQPIHVGMGFETDITSIKDWCKELGFALHVQSTDIGRIVFEEKKEKSPCSLCSNLRRSALNTAAMKLKCNKVALAHHLDDAIETFFLSLIYSAQLKTFAPLTYLDRTKLTIIRPFIYLHEKDIIKLSKKLSLPVITNPCPANQKTKREEMKNLIKELSKKYPSLKENFVTALKNFNAKNLWPPPCR